MATGAKSSPTYAKGTEVPVERSRNEIEKLLKRYGADGFMYGDKGALTMIAFEMRGRHIRMSITCPALSFYTDQGYFPAQAKRLYEQKYRELWRGLVLLTKAKLVAIEAGVTTLEKAFLDDTVLPDDSTVGEWLEPQMQQVYTSGRMPPLLPGYRPPSGGQKQLQGGSHEYVEGIILEE